jgi:hypothetical protein
VYHLTLALTANYIFKKQLFPAWQCLSTIHIFVPLEADALHNPVSQIEMGIYPPPSTSGLL